MDTSANRLNGLNGAEKCPGSSPESIVWRLCVKTKLYSCSCFCPIFYVYTDLAYTVEDIRLIVHSTATQSFWMLHWVVNSHSPSSLQRLPQQCIQTSPEAVSYSIGLVSLFRKITLVLCFHAAQLCLDALSCAISLCSWLPHVWCPKATACIFVFICGCINAYDAVASENLLRSLTVTCLFSCLGICLYRRGYGVVFVY